VPVREQIAVALLAAWLGAALLMTLVVAPAAFAALPSRALAGLLVGRVLPALFYGGMATGVAVAALTWNELRLPHRRVRIASALLLSSGSAIAQLVVGPRIARLRASIGPSLDALAADDPRRVAFGRLHGVSVLWLGVAMVGALLALVFSMLAARPRS
jgi:hypothetical protein